MKTLQLFLYNPLFIFQTEEINRYVSFESYDANREPWEFKQPKHLISNYHLRTL